MTHHPRQFELTKVHPLHDDILVIGLVPDHWPSPWMARHNILSRLGKYFRVLWINPARHIHDSKHETDPKNNIYQLNYRSGFETVHLKTPSVYGPRLLAKFLTRMQAGEINTLARKFKPKKIIAYVWRPDFVGMLDNLKCDKIYYHIDDEYNFDKIDGQISTNELKILRKSSKVIFHSPELYHKKGGYNPESHIIPMGANYKLFSTPVQEPDDLRLIPKPRIGYIGFVKGQLDLKLLAELARMHKNYSFVFVGPQSVNISRYRLDFEELFAQSNVYMMGQRAIDMLPAYTQHMDVLLLPYKNNNYTRYISPMKLNEYLSTGRPVVATPISYLKQFSKVIKCAETPEQWSELIAKSLSLSENNYHNVKRRQVTAAKSDWERVTHRIANLMAMDVGRNIPAIIDVSKRKSFKIKPQFEVLK